MHRFWLQNYNAMQKLTGAHGDSCVLPCSSPVKGSTKTERHHTFQGREGFLSWLFDGMRLFKPVLRQCFIFLFVLFRKVINKFSLVSIFYHVRSTNFAETWRENRGSVNRLLLF